MMISEYQKEKISQDRIFCRCANHDFRFQSVAQQYYTGFMLFMKEIQYKKIKIKLDTGTAPTVINANWLFLKPSGQN